MALLWGISIGKSCEQDQETTSESQAPISVKKKEKSQLLHNKEWAHHGWR